jgi:DNA-binding MarR family transcriptional regulator
MNNPPSEPAVTTWARLLLTQTQLLDYVNAALKAARLPPLTWYDVLLELHRARDGGLRQYEIGAKTLLSKYNLSRLIDKLEHEHLVQRLSCPEDGRGNVVRITDAGTKLLKRMWPVYGGAIHAQLEGKLTPAEISALGEILNKLIKQPDPTADRT